MDPSFVSRPSSGTADTRFLLNDPGDSHEQEADHVADRVMQQVKFGIRPVETSHAPLQRSSSNSTQRTEIVGPIAHEIHSLRGRGSPLDGRTRSFMEPRFGQDFSHVRVHTDASAAEMARSVNALAFTVGSHLVFGSGQYSPGTETGKRLLAHELAHVVQQRGHFENSHIMRRLDPSLCARNCAAPDTMGGGVPSAWKLTLAVDMEQKGLGRLISGNVGHTWVRLADNAGTKYSYGFWPQVGFNSKKPFSSVAGCVHHPDTAHEPPNATNYSEKEYSITKPQYDQALSAAQSVCAAKPSYNLVTYNCTTFGIDTVKAAGMSPPASTTLAIHNPNALYEGIQEGKSGHPGVGALVGGLGGAAAGAALGSLGGVGGAIAGGILGGVAGLIGGTLIGESI